MSERVSRRQIMAAILLTGDPVALRQGSGDYAEKLYIEFDSIGDLRAWLAAAGLDGPNLLSDEWVADTTGELRACAWPTWHGWPITASATDPAAVPVELAVETVDALTELAARGGVS